MIENYSTLYGEQTRISSLHPLNAANKADAWQSKAINYLNEHPSSEQYNEIKTAGDETYVRMMIPMFTEPSCLKCHDPATNPLGHMRGGIDVMVPLQVFYTLTQSGFFKTLSGLFLIWVTGVAMVIVGFRVIESKAEKLRSVEIEKVKNYQNMISLVVDLIDKRDAYTAGHSHRVAQYCEMIARAVYEDEADVNKIKEAATMHDIGKIAIPDSILLKPSHLNDHEYNLIQYHLTAGYELLSRVEIYRDLSEIIRYHHERFDGTGYPQGLSGKQIPLASRIMIIADAFDAMTTDRIYKPHKSVQEALDEIERLKGAQFDPEIADIAITVLRDVNIEATSQMPQTEIEEERFAYYLKDQLTGLNNHWALEAKLGTNQSTREYLFATVIVLDNMSVFNQKHGWERGEKLLKDFGAFLNDRYAPRPVYHIFGDYYVILSAKLLDISPIHLANMEPLEGTHIGLTIRNIDLIEENVENIRRLEELLKAG
jgi:putative nucleotidyltransferase with HDIG domain